MLRCHIHEAAMDFGGDWNKLVAYVKALEARVAALEARTSGLQFVPVSAASAAAEPAPKPRKRS